MFDWFSSDKRRAREIQEKAERDARLRAELAVKAKQFDEENRHQFQSMTEMTNAKASQQEAEVVVNRKEKRVPAEKPASTTTILNYSARTSFNF